MSQYEFECPDCGFKFEQFHYLYTKTALCPKCSGIAKLVPSVVNFIFGWRLTEKSHERFAKDELEKAI